MQSSSLKAIAGLLVPLAGEIECSKQPAKKRSAYELVQLGLGMVPEDRGVFKRMTILENLQMGAYLKSNTQEIERKLEEVFLCFPRLKKCLSQLAGTLSGGGQQMVTMGRAMMAEPKLLLLGEPSMGLSLIMVETSFDVIWSLSASGMTILLVEQNARLALQMVERAYLMESGLVTLSGSGKDLLEDTRVRNAYLGE